MRRAIMALVALLFTLGLTIPAWASPSHSHPGDIQVGPEMFEPRTQLSPGESVTYYFGPSAPGGDTTLSDQLIFDSYNDGLAVVIGNGDVGTTVMVRCDQASAQQQLTSAYRVPQQGLVEASVDCADDPETATIKNNSALPLTIESIASMAEPETFFTDDKVLPDSSITYYFGPNAPDGDTTLSKQLVFNDQNDGVQVSTAFLQSADTIGGSTAAVDGVGCDEGSYTGNILRTAADVSSKIIGTYTITLDCASDPETVTITNNSIVPILPGGITSLVGGTPTPGMGGMQPKTSMRTSHKLSNSAGSGMARKAAYGAMRMLD